jgi:hypothetical protein
MFLLGVFLISGFGFAYSLIAGRVLTAWPMPPVVREDDPMAFWVLTGIYGSAAFVASLGLLVRVI